MTSIYRLYTFLLLLIFTTFGVLKPINLLPDMQTYKEYFDAVKSNSLVLVDVSYILISKLVINFSNSFRWVILFYVFFSLYIKFYAFRFFKYKTLILLMYLSSLLVLHEFIQIRIALALAFLIVGVIYSQTHIFRSVLFFLLGAFFHASAIVFVFFFFLSKILNRRRLVATIFLFLFFIISFKLEHILNLIVNLHSNYMLDKLVIYINASNQINENVNVFSLRMLVLYIVILFSAVRIRKISSIEFSIFFSLCCTIISAIGLRSVPDISFRLIDISIFFSIFLISSLSNYYSKKFFYSMVFIFIFSSIHYNIKLLEYIIS